MKDIDGNEYKTVKIGEQEWMAENLKVSHYRNGNSVRVDKFNNSHLYNWDAIRWNIAPEGWHIPSITEWNQLMKYLGTNAGGKMKIAGIDIWEEPNTGATNESGFSATPNNYYGEYGYSRSSNSSAHWWSSTTKKRNRLSRFVWAVSIGSASTKVFKKPYNTHFFSFSIRCIKD